MHQWWCYEGTNRYPNIPTNPKLQRIFTLRPADADSQIHATSKEDEEVYIRDKKHKSTNTPSKYSYFTAPKQW